MGGAAPEMIEEEGHRILNSLQMVAPWSGRKRMEKKIGQVFIMHCCCYLVPFAALIARLLFLYLGLSTFFNHRSKDPDSQETPLCHCCCMRRRSPQRAQQTFFRSCRNCNKNRLHTVKKKSSKPVRRRRHSRV